MTKLEKILSVTLAVVTTGYVTTVIEAVKHVKKEQEDNAKVLEICHKIQEMLDKHE